MGMRRGWVVPLAGLALTIGCSSGGTAEKDAMVTGDFVRVGGPAPGAAVPLTGTLRFVSDSRNVVVNVPKDGRFVVHLPAGKYAVKGTSSQIARGSHPCSVPLELALSSGEVLRQQVICPIR